jgi:hypothetical protein
MLATPLLLNLGSLGRLRELLLTPALGALMPVPGHFGVHAGTGVAAAVIAGWTLIPASLDE